MPKTMVANISGARLREAERQLAQLKGAAAVNDFLESHPNETKVLQQLVDWRRAGRPAPSLARVQRAMLWSDGTIELSTIPGPEPAPRPSPGRPGAPRGAPRGARSGPGAPGGAGGARSGRPGRPGAAGPPAYGQRGRPRQRQLGEGESAAGLPRSGEGWALLRPGESPPPDAPAPGGAEAGPEEPPPATAAPADRPAGEGEAPAEASGAMGPGER
jgi:hypothetical protein